MFDRHYARRAGLGADGTTLADRWARACQGAGLVRTVQTVSGPTEITPQVERVEWGPPPRLHVRLEPGQVPDDVVQLTGRLAPHLAAFGLRVEARGHGDRVVVTLLPADPLTATVPPSRPVASVLAPVTLGMAEDGSRVTLDLATSAHMVVAGATGSGKSIFSYSLLGQLADAPDVVITGSDVSALLLRPWQETRHAAGLALGTGSPEHHVDVLEAAVAEMDKRTAGIPLGRDKVRLGTDTPAMIVVIEEWPGAMRWLDSCDPKLTKRAKAAVARLLSEGRKAGVRVVLVVQRADAAIIGAFERGQAGHRLSFRLDGLDGVKMLHPDATAELAAQHSAAPPGVALLSAPGRPLSRLRVPHVDYATYCATVAAAAA